MPVYRTTFAVDAPAPRIWEALTALDRYPEWNPQIPRIRGSLRPGQRIDLQLAVGVDLYPFASSHVSPVPTSTASGGSSA